MAVGLFICSKSSSGTVERLKFTNRFLSCSLETMKTANIKIEAIKQMLAKNL